MEYHKDLQLLFFPTFELWLEWLEENHSQPQGIWLKFAKKASGIQSITYEEAREGALMYGWIDGLKNGLDETYYTLRFTPRLPKGVWSKINREIALGLIRDGKMKPAGLRQVEAAQKDGRFEAAYDSQSTIHVPDDFKLALEKSPAAAEFFATLKGSNRYAFLYRIQTAKKPETRASRIEKFIEMLESGDTFY